MARKTQEASSDASAHQQNQLNLSRVDFKFKAKLGEGRCGKTLRCDSAERKYRSPEDCRSA